MKLELTHLHLRILIGVAIKTLGYLIVAAGIFLSIKDKTLALKVVYIGVSFVVVGWVVVIRSLRLAKVVRVPKAIRLEKRTKISAHISGGRYGVISEGDNVEVSGKCLSYDPVKRGWKPSSGVIKLILDNSEIGKIDIDGEFKFSFKAPKRGEHSLEIRFIGDEPNYKVLRFKVLSRDERRRILILTNLAYICIITFFMAFFVILLRFLLKF